MIQSTLMDGTTEPVVAVIGYPVAGNPTQFALETGFAAAGVDCRVISVGLADEVLEDAIRGMLAMRFRGVWVDATRRDRVTKVADDGEPLPVESLVIDRSSDDPNDAKWTPVRVRHPVWKSLVASRNAFGQASPRGALIIGDNDELRQDLQADLVREDEGGIVMSPDNIRTFRRFVSTIGTDDVGLIFLTSPLNDREALISRVAASGEGPVMIVDLNEDWQSWTPISFDFAESSRSVIWIDAVEIHAETLVRLCKLWIDATISRDVLRDAIEEYLAM